MKLLYYHSQYYRVYDGIEAEREFGPLVRSILIDDDHPENLIFERGSKIFRNPDWRIIGIDMAPWGDDQREMVPNNVPENVVQIEERTGLWCPFRPLYHALVERCTDEVIHICPATEERARSFLQYGATATPPIEDTSAINSGVGPVIIGPFGIMFSREGDWAVFGDRDGYLSILGAAPPLMERVLELGGGEEFMARTFKEMCNYLTGPYPEATEYFSDMLRAVDQ